MKKDSADLSESEALFREEALHGDIFHIILKTCIPLVIYECVTLVFALFDTAISAYLGEDCVSTTAYISQITFLIGSVGLGLSVGCSIILGNYCGSGQFKKMKQTISTSYFICALFSLPFLSILINPSAILRLLGATENIICIGYNYFRIELIAKVFSYFTALYLVIERTRGNTRRIMVLNIAIIIIKLSLSALFVFIMGKGLVSLAIASLTSIIILFIGSIFFLRNSATFSFSISEITFEKDIFAAIIKTSLPIIFEQVSLYAGKIIINSMSISYGELAVGALGVSNNLGGIGVSPQMGIQEGSISIISQNVGAGNAQRVHRIFRAVLLIMIASSLISLTLVVLFFDKLIGVYSTGNYAFGELIAIIYRYEMLGFIPLGISSAICSLLYAYKKTIATFIINLSRVFLLRIPVLYFLQHFTTLGIKSLGIVMLTSNGGILLISIIIAQIYLKKVLSIRDFVPNCR